MNSLLLSVLSSSPLLALSNFSLLSFDLTLDHEIYNIMKRNLFVLVMFTHFFSVNCLCILKLNALRKFSINIGSTGMNQTISIDVVRKPYHKDAWNSIEMFIRTVICLFDLGFCNIVGIVYLRF